MARDQFTSVALPSSSDLGRDEPDEEKSWLDKTKEAVKESGRHREPQPFAGKR